MSLSIKFLLIWLLNGPPQFKGLASPSHKEAGEFCKGAFSHLTAAPGRIVLCPALSKRPSVLLEPAYVSCRGTRGSRANTHFQQKFAEGVANGIISFVKKIINVNYTLRSLGLYFVLFIIGADNIS